VPGNCELGIGLISWGKESGAEDHRS